MSKIRSSVGTSSLPPTLFALLTLGCLLLLIVQATVATPLPGGTSHSVANTTSLADTTSTSNTTTVAGQGNILDIREWPYFAGGIVIIILCLVFVCCCLSFLGEACYCVVILVILGLAGFALVGTGIFNHLHPPDVSSIHF